MIFKLRFLSIKLIFTFMFVTTLSMPGLALEHLQTIAGKGTETKNDGKTSVVSFHSLGNIFAASLWGGTIKIYGFDGNEASEITEKVSGTLNGHRSSVFSLAWHPTEYILGSGSLCRVQLDRFEDNSIIHFKEKGIDNRPYSLAFKFDGELWGINAINGRCRFWHIDCQMGDLEHHDQDELKHYGSIFSFAWNSQESILAAALYANSGNRIKFWMFDGDTIDHLYTIECGWEYAHTNFINSIAWHPSSNILISGSTDRSIKLWHFDGKQAEHIDTLIGHTESVFTVVWHSMGKFFASCSCDGEIKLWHFDNNTATCIQTIDASTYEHFKEGVSDIAFSPNGNHLVSITFNGTITVWRFLQGAHVKSARNVPDPLVQEL